MSGLQGGRCSAPRCRKSPPEAMPAGSPWGLQSVEHSQDGGPYRAAQKEGCRKGKAGRQPLVIQGLISPINLPIVRRNLSSIAVNHRIYPYSLPLIRTLKPAPRFFKAATFCPGITNPVGK